MASRNDFIHRYSEAGFWPVQVGAALDLFTDALRILPREDETYVVHGAEVAAFELYLNRTLVPAPPELHDLRCGAILRTVAKCMDEWGDTGYDVTLRLALDVMPPRDFAGIAEIVESAIGQDVVAQAISFEVNGVRVDGVLVDYSQAVNEALVTAALDATRQAARRPF